MDDYFRFICIIKETSRCFIVLLLLLDIVTRLCILLLLDLKHCKCRRVFFDDLLFDVVIVL